VNLALATDELGTLLASSEYLSYAYSYPHKTAYRALDLELRRVWASEDRSALFLYLHVPFCEQRCGFCNLFTQAQPRAELEERYVAAVERQAAVLADLLAPAQFAQLAIGGGTPTFLSARLLDRMFAVAHRLGARNVPTSVEVSPATLDAEKVAVLVARGTTRVSMGVQSFVAAETHAVQRPQDVAQVEHALALLRDRVPTRNVDLIYGLPGQTADSLRWSIDRTIELGANELYLYPLYVRPLTVLGRKAGWRDERLALYRAGRDHLRAQGFRQASMRMFTTAVPETALYRCQQDGMVGLGAGARSYTRSVHYASPYAVAQTEVRARIASWLEQPDAEHAVARHGFVLDAHEQRRRYLLLSLLETGVDRADYRAQFDGDLFEHMPELAQLLAHELATADAAHVRLTERGVERSDVIGYWLQSPAVQARRASWTAT
jgi:oxygen-independent coproporphyrinogen III oxidase